MKKQALPIYPDVYGVGENQRGVKYLYNLYEKHEVIAKVCTSCDEWKFMHQYNKAGKGFAGTHSLCRDCHQQRNKEYTDFNKAMEKISDVIDEYEQGLRTEEVNQIARVRGVTLTEAIAIHEREVNGGSLLQ